MKKRTVIIIVAVTLAVLAAAAAAIAVAADIRAGRETVKPCEHSISYFYIDGEGSTRFLYDGKLLDGAVAGSVSAFLSCDGTVAIFSAGSELYRVNESGVSKIFPAGVLRAALSLDNSTVAFTTSTQFHVYRSASDSIETVKPDNAAGIPAIAVSNDGATCAYTVKTADGKYLAYVYENGESRLIAENAYVLAVSSGAKIFWYVDPASSTLYYKKGSSVKKAAENVSGLVEFNRDLTEAMFDISGVTHYSKNGSRARAIVENASVFTTKPQCAATNGGEQATGSVADVSSLFGCVFYTTLTSSRDQSVKVFNLYYVDRFCRSRELALGADSFAVYGNKLAVSVDRTLYVMSSDDPGTARKVADGVYSFSVKDNGDLYALALDKTLYFIDGGETSLPLAQNVIHQVLVGDRCLYLADYDKTGTLMLADGRRPIVKVMEGVAHYAVKPGVQFLYTDYYENSFGTRVCDVYSSADGHDFSLVLEGAVFPGSEE